jgi:bacillolysin
MQQRRLPSLLLIFVLSAMVFPSAALAAPPSPATPTPAATVANLIAVTDGQARVTYQSGTGFVSFIGTDPQHPITQPSQLAADAAPEDGARGFLATYGHLFGVQDQAAELRVMRTQTAGGGRSYVRFQQVDGDIPIMGGELIVQLDGQKNVVSAIGQALPSAKISHTPAIGAASAAQRAIQTVAKHKNVAESTLAASTPSLWLHNPAILGGPGPQVTRLAWQVEVSGDEPPVKQLVLVDAQLGAIIDTVEGLETALNRRVYDNQNLTTWSPLLPGNGPVRTEGQAATGITDVDNAYNYAGTFYNFYKNKYNRDSIDNQGMTLIATARYCDPQYTCPFANAFWNGEQMVYGDGYASALDVVAHEMTHGVTDKESHLFYFYQSGAINESFSDIWGEMIEHDANPSADPTWRMGEDLSIGAIRSMSDPTIFNDPDSMTSGNYTCDPGLADNGGVHQNSGVGNKAAYLIIKGGTFNGQTVTGIGIDKAAQIYYDVQTHLFTSASDYESLYNSLQQACTTLTGQYGITASDCQQVQKAVTAVAMNQQHTGCAAPDAPVGPAGQTASSLFYDDLENTASGNWTTQTLTGSNTWYYPENSNPYGFDALYATSGAHNFWGYDLETTSDSAIAMTQNVALPAGQTVYMRFNHAYVFEASGSYYDGGVVEYSTNGGSTWTDAGSLFVNNGYVGTLATGTPLGTRQVFGGQSFGYISSRLSLGTLAGQNVRFRFRIGTDSTGWNYGWFIDDVRLYTCTGTETYPYHTYLPVVRKMPPPAPPQPVVNGTFEAGSTGWTQFSLNGYIMPIGNMPYPNLPGHSGTWYAWLGGSDDEISYVQQQVTVSPSTPYLVYYHRIGSQDVCGYDFGGVLVNNTVVDVYNLCSSQSTNGWVRHAVNLSAYAGQIITFQVRAETDSSENSNLFVDDVALSASAAAPAGETGPAYTPAFTQPKAGATAHPSNGPAPKRLFGDHVK